VEKPLNSHEVVRALHTALDAISVWTRGMASIED
jgi:hypothetical protein